MTSRNSTVREAVLDTVADPARPAAYHRQTAIFDPVMDRPVLGTIVLVGAGALGTAAALALAKMGVGDFAVYDPDTVEVHNSPNQVLFAATDAGQHKVSVLSRALQTLTGTTVSDPRGRGQLFRLSVQVNVLRFPPAMARQYDTVVVATDNLPSRARIWEQAKQEGRCRTFIDLRMGGRAAVRYVLTRNPHGEWNPQAVMAYEDLLTRTPDDDACGARSFIGTAMICGGLFAQSLAYVARGQTVPFELAFHYDHPAMPITIVGPGYEPPVAPPPPAPESNDRTVELVRLLRQVPLGPLNREGLRAIASALLGAGAFSGRAEDLEPLALAYLWVDRLGWDTRTTNSLDVQVAQGVSAHLEGIGLPFPLYGNGLIGPGDPAYDALWAHDPTNGRISAVEDLYALPLAALDRDAF